MLFNKRIKKEVKQAEFDYTNCEVLTYEQLLAVNGAGGSSSGSSGSGAASAPCGKL